MGSAHSGTLGHLGLNKVMIKRFYYNWPLLVYSVIYCFHAPHPSIGLEELCTVHCAMCCVVSVLSNLANSRQGCSIHSVTRGGAISGEIKHIDRGRKKDIKVVREFIFRWAPPVYELVSLCQSVCPSVIPSEVNSPKRDGCRGLNFCVYLYLIRWKMTQNTYGVPLSH